METSLSDLFTNSAIETSRINRTFFNKRMELNDIDKNAAWEMYIALLTSYAIKPINKDNNNIEIVLNAFDSLDETTIAILNKYGNNCIEFAKIAIIVLNQVIKPFIARCYNIPNPEVDRELLQDLNKTQDKLRSYCRILSTIVDVENITSLENRE